MNLFVASGRVSKIIDSKGKKSSKGKSKFQFDFACNTTYKNAEGETLTTFLRVVSYGKQAEMLEASLSVGSPLIIQGQLIDSKYVNQDGEKRTFRFLLPNKQEGITFLESKDASELRKKAHKAHQETHKETADEPHEPTDPLPDEVYFPDEVDETYPF